jgi:RNA polymerase sigma-70 factor (ECF subfamily)
VDPSNPGEDVMPGTLEAADIDERLVERFKRGDEAAFEELVHRHRERIYRAAWRVAGDHAEADDLAQESFLRAYRSLSGFRGESRFLTWMMRILMNLALSRRGSRRFTVPLEEARHVGMGEGAGESALRRQVREAVGRLPSRQRQVLLLKVYEQMKFTEVAEAMGISVGTAKATFFQAVRGLRKRLGVRPGGECPEEEVGA